MWIGLTSECFHSSGISHRRRHEFTMWSRTGLITGRDSLMMRIQIPSRPEADVPDILRMMLFSIGKSTGVTEKEHAPTRGSLQGIRGSFPCSRASWATLGPTPTKYSFMLVADVRGTVLCWTPPPPPRCLGCFATECGPRSRIRSAMSARQSRRTADRTALLASRYELEPCPSVLSTARRRAIKSLVASVTGGAVGLRIMTFRTGA